MRYGDIVDIFELEMMCDRFDMPNSYREDIRQILQSLGSRHRRKFETRTKEDDKRIKDLVRELDSFKKTINEKIKSRAHILYLPTYRRIEQELFDEDSRRNRNIRSEREDNYTILKEFGMRDVDEDIKNTLINLRESSRTKLNELTLGYLGDIVNKQYSTNDFHEITSITPEKIDDIMKRVNETILPQDKKDTLKKTLLTIKDQVSLSDHEKILCYYFLKLEKYNNELIEQEQNIKDFANVCKSYLVNKNIEYDRQNFEFTIKLKNHDLCTEEIEELDNDIMANKEKISLQDLSSGEKQIVSLFSHLYLSKKQNYIVLIDEPELSLSVEWQRMFLSDVKKGKFCKGLVAVTHSPFIFENELDSYAHAMEEFKD